MLGETPVVTRMASWRAVPACRSEWPRTSAPTAYVSLVANVTKASETVRKVTTYNVQEL